MAGDWLRKNAILKKTAPAKNNQNPTALRKGNAKSRAPICNGTATFIKPSNNGIAAKKIIIVPCVVKTSLYFSCWNTQNSLFGSASCKRINSAYILALRKKIILNRIYNVPIFRWLVVVMYSQITGNFLFLMI